MLRFVLGRSGCGKSEYLRRRFAESARAGEEKLLFLVPDQISFETEAAFLELLGPALSRNILVLGFSRLCDYVFEATGNRYASFADDGVCHLMMSLALEQVHDSLTVFDKRSQSADMRELMLSAVKEYKKCAVSSDDLRRAAQETEDEALCGKLNDTALVYDAYNAIMERSYMDPLDALSKVYYLLQEHRLFEGYTVALDAFYGFTAQEYNVIELLMAMSKEMTVALTDDCREDSASLFYVPRRTRARLSRIARNHGIAIAPYTELTVPRRFQNEALCSLEANAYRIEKEPYAEAAGAVTVYRAAEIYDECDFVARTIRALTQEGYRYRDMAVIARSTDPYVGVLDTYLDKYGIRYFMDKPQYIDAMPLVRLVTAVFEIVNRGFQREDILTMLKTGLCGYTAAEIGDFENYLFVWDVNGRGFFRPFTNPPGGFADEMSDDEKALLGRIERLRSDIVGKLKSFADQVKDTDGKAISKALMKLLYALKVDDNINGLCDAYEAQGETEAAEDSVRIWNVLCGVLDKTVAVIGDYRITAKRYAELLYANVAALQISVIPRSMDEVDVAAADRTLISDKKIVFIIGALDGEFPRMPVEAGVFTDDERVRLKEELQLPLSDSIEELAATERYYAYSALTAAGERLYLSFPAADLRGESLSPSDVVGETERSLPQAVFINYDTVPLSERLLSKRAAFDYLVRHYQSKSPDINALKAYFKTDEDYRDVICSIEAVLGGRLHRIHDKSLARELYGKEMRLSSTKIGVYHQCPFRWFCEYGLHIRERRRATVDALEYGTLMHHIFETFFGGYSREEYIVMEKENVADIVSDIVDRYIEMHFGGKEDKSERFLYLLYRIKLTAARLVLHMTRELAQSDFIPVDFELGIGTDIPDYSIELQDGLRLTVRGSVDRVDRCDTEGESYIRVIDYKTGVKDFNIRDILYGLNLQMFLYLYAIRENGGDRYGEITPAGVLYMPAVSPSVPADPDTSADKIREEILKQYRMKGVVLDNAEVISHMEHDGKGVYIPAKLRGGTVSAGAGSLATLEQMGSIFRHIDLLMTQMAQALYDGDVAAMPLKGSSYDGCAYCVYQAVCLREEDDPCREAENADPSEVYRRLSEEGDAHD